MHSNKNVAYDLSWLKECGFFKFDFEVAEVFKPSLVAYPCTEHSPPTPAEAN